MNAAKEQVSLFTMNGAIDVVKIDTYDEIVAWIIEAPEGWFEVKFEPLFGLDPGARKFATYTGAKNWLTFTINCSARFHVKGSL